MKLLYIKSKLRNININLSKEEISKLPKKLSIIYTIQYKEEASKIRSYLEENKIKVSGFIQILGCTRLRLKEPVLYIGSGKFHLTNVLMEDFPVYYIAGNRIEKVSDKESDIIKNKKKISLMKFLNAETIGIIISSKPGQFSIQTDFNKVIELKERLNKKKCFLFVTDNIDVNDLENFPISSWVNTACPGISLDSNSILNYADIPFDD